MAPGDAGRAGEGGRNAGGEAPPRRAAADADANANANAPDAARRLATAEELDAARKLYLAGFAFLPWLWFMMAAHFWSRSKHDERLAVYVRRSVVGFAASAVLLAAWIAWFQTSWRGWGAVGQQMLVNPVPTPPPAEW